MGLKLDGFKIWEFYFIFIKLKRMKLENGNVSYIVEEDICNTYNQQRACFENMKKNLTNQ